MGEATKAAELSDPDLGASSIDRAINRVAEVLGVMVLVAIIALVFSNAAGRYLGGNMIIWADEVVISLMPWLGMLGMFLSIRRRQVIKIDYFVSKMPPRVAKAVLLFADIMSAAVFLYFAVISFQYVGLFGNDKTIYLRIPTGWFSSALVIGAGGAALAYLAHFIRDARRKPADRNRYGERRMIGALISIVLLLTLLVFGMPMLVSLTIAVVVSFFLSGQWTLILPQSMISGVSSFTLVALPLFIVSGLVMNAGGISGRLFDFARSLVGWMRGGLAQVDVLTSIFFGGMIGSSTADLAGSASIIIPQMKKEGYPPEMAAAVSASSSGIGPLIPPSSPAILYSAVTGTSLGALFIAGLIPGSSARAASS